MLLVEFVDRPEDVRADEPMRLPTLDSTTSATDGGFTLRASPSDLTESARGAVADLQVRASDGTLQWLFDFTARRDPDDPEQWLDAAQEIDLSPSIGC